MVSPAIGGIDVYVKALADELRKISNVEVDVKGGSEDQTAYDQNKRDWRPSEQIKEMVKDISDLIKFDNYDYVLFHYGKNDVEQYIPVILSKNKERFQTKFVYFVHYLSWNLFSHYLKDPVTAREVESATLNFFDEYVFFGDFARNFIEDRYHKRLEGKIIFLPETHANEKLSQDEVEKYTEFFQGIYIDKYKKVVYYAGFGSNYKDIEAILKAFEEVEEELLFVIAGKGWLKRVGFEKKRIGKIQVMVIEKYLDSKEYKFLSSQTLFGIFPYKQPQQEDEFFQGSGTLPNYINAGKATIVYNEGSLPEYVGDSGIVIKTGDINELKEAINTLLDDVSRKQYEEAASKISENFSIKNHVKEVYDYLKSIS